MPCPQCGRLRGGAWMVVALALAAASCARLGAAEREDMERAIGRVFPALVRITVVAEEPGEGRMQKQVGAGSGAIISDQGHVITNHHVAGKARHIVCRLADGEEIEGRLVGTDPLADIAVIQLDLSRRKSKQKLPVARFGDSDRLRIGDAVLAMGSPMAVTQSVTRGIVSNTQLMMPGMYWMAQMELDGEKVGSLVRWIGHDAVIYGGNSGGPLVNLEGEIIGINEVGLASLGGAIPGNLARSVAEQLIARGTVDRSWTGIEAQPLLRGSGAEKGVLVSGVIEGSPAAKAGLRAGDIVTEFDGVPVAARLQEDLPTFNALVMGTPVGKQVSIKAIRGGSELQASLTTAARGKALGADVEFKDWGFTARDLTMLSAIELKRADTRGVLISSVNASGPAGSAKPPLAASDTIIAVGGKPVGSVAALRAITGELTAGGKAPGAVVVEFERGVSRMLTAVDLKVRDPRPEVNARKPGLSMLLQPIGVELGEALGLKGEGVRVAFVFPGGSAEAAGFRAGDIITRFDGEKVRCTQASELEYFLASVRRQRVGNEVPCELLRDKATVKVTLKLEADDPEQEELAVYKDRNLDMTVRELTRRERILQRLPDEVRGVRIEAVQGSGWAGLAHVASGDLLLAIDGQPTPDVASAEKMLKSAAEKKPRRLVFHIRRGVHTFFAELEPAWDSAAGGNK